MKKIIFSILAIAAVVLMSSCTKHKMHFDAIELPDGDIAEFQMHYMEAVSDVAANYFDSVFVNDKLYSSSKVKGTGVLAPKNGIPWGGAGGRFFYTNVGSNNFKLYRNGELAYDKNVTLTKGKQNIIIYDMTKDPIVIDNGFPYWEDRSSLSTAATWNTDSVFKLQFINLLFETPGVPYSGKLQYQYQRVGNILDPFTGVKIGTEPSDWFNMGEAVGFGETTGLQMLVMHKQTFNSSGSQRFNYRILDEAGNVLKVWNGSKMVNYSDYWNAYIGRVYMHFFCGSRTSNPACEIKQWASM